MMASIEDSTSEALESLLQCRPGFRFEPKTMPQPDTPRLFLRKQRKEATHI